MGQTEITAKMETSDRDGLTLEQLERFAEFARRQFGMDGTARVRALVGWRGQITQLTAAQAKED